MRHEELCQRATVDEFDPGVDPVCLEAGTLGESRGGDGDPAVALLSQQGSRELVDSRTVSRPILGTALGLNMDPFQSQRISADDPVDLRHTSSH
jgi:hypothetical protein